MTDNNQQLELDLAPASEISSTPKSTLFQQVKKWAGIIWHVPGIQSAALSLIVKLLVRVGLPAGLGTLIVAVADAIGGNL